MRKILTMRRIRLYTIMLLICGLIILFIVNWVTRGQLFLRFKYDILEVSRNSAISNLRVFPDDPIKMFLNPADKIITPNIMLNGIWEWKETHWFLRNVREGDVVLDIGANVGYYTLIAARLVGIKGRIYAFEPDPVSFKILDQNVKLNGFKNVVLEPKAVSNEKGSIKLYLAESNKGDHRIYQTKENRPFVEIEAVTLDDYFKNYKGRIDFVKIDTQGAEVVILRGMEKLIRSNEDIRMAIEFWPYGFSGLGTNGKECLDILRSHDFLFFDISGSSQPRDLRQVEAPELLAKYTITNERFTNLLVVKGRAEFKRLKTIVTTKAKALGIDTVEDREAHSEYQQAEKELQDFIKKVLSRRK